MMYFHEFRCAINVVSGIGRCTYEVHVVIPSPWVTSYFPVLNDVSRAPNIRLGITLFRGKSPILSGLARQAQNIGRFSINLEGSAKGGYDDIRSWASIHV